MSFHFKGSPGKGGYKVEIRTSREAVSQKDGGGGGGGGGKCPLLPL